jgi:NAD-dependent dihydropyrimidine dehydrogenase PreA subunit
MRIDQDYCIKCGICVPYCPVEAIDTEEGDFIIDQELCVDCGVCVRSGACKVEAIFLPETPWPRSIRAAFSGGGHSFFVNGKRYNPDGSRRYERIEQKMPLEKLTFKDVKEKRVGFGSRGTSEMKTNDRTARFKEGEVGIAAEMGRPGVSFCFEDLEKVSVALSKIGVEFELENPVSIMLNLETGRIRDDYAEIRGERALSAIVECKAPMERTPEIYLTLQKVAKEIDTVFSLDIINKCREGKPPLKKILDAAGVGVRINGKTNIGLGRPLIP